MPLRLAGHACYLAIDRTVCLLLRSAGSNRRSLAVDVAEADIAVGPCSSSRDSLTIYFTLCDTCRACNEPHQQDTAEKHCKPIPRHDHRSPYRQIKAQSAVPACGASNEKIASRQMVRCRISIHSMSGGPASMRPEPLPSAPPEEPIRHRDHPLPPV